MRARDTSEGEKRRRYVREHILQENTFSKRTHSIRDLSKRRREEEKGSATDKSLIECVLLENVFSWRMCSLTYKGSATDKSLIECVLLENVFSYIQIDLLT